MIGFGYNGSDQLTLLTRQNGNTGDIVPATSYDYEAATGRLAGIEHTLAVGLNSSSPSWTRYVDAFSYAYDRADRLTAWETLLDGAASYAYDERERFRREVIRHVAWHAGAKCTITSDGANCRHFARRQPKIRSPELGE